MQKVQITDHEIFIYEININKKGLRRIQKNTLRKSKDLIMHTSSIPLNDYPKCFEKNGISICAKAKMFQSKNSMIYTTIFYPNIVRIIEEFRHYNFNNLPDLIMYNQENPELVSKILENVEFKELYHDTYNDYFDLFDKLKNYSDTSISTVIDEISEKSIPDEMHLLIKK